MTTKALVLGIGSIGLAAWLCVGSAVAASDPAASCTQKKAKAAGKKTNDILKGYGKHARKPNASKLASDISKAQSKFTKSFTKEESKGGCATTDDAPMIEAKVDAFVDDILLQFNALAKEVTDAGSCVQGPLSRCRVGDYLMENDRIRVVVQDVQRNMFGIGQYGGQIIDADLRRDPGEDEIDNFEEFSTNLNIENTAHYTDITIVNDGTDGSPAVIRATGPDDLLDFLNPSSVVASFGFTFPPAADDTDLPVEISTDYILEPGVNYVRVETTVQNTDAIDPVDMYFGEFMNGSGQVELFQPGYGFGETLVSSTCPSVVGTETNPCNAIIYRGADDAAGVSYGYVHDVSGSTAFTASGVTVPLLGVEITLVLVGAVPPNFHLEPQGMPGDQFTVTRYFVVGDGTVSSILDARNEIQELTTGTLTGTVETASGGPVAGAEVAVLDDPANGPAFLGPLTFNVASHTVTDASGSFTLTIPPGDYDVAVNLEHYPYEGGGSSPTLHPVTITADMTTNVGTITIPDTGALVVNVDDGTGGPLPAKASVIGFDPSPAQLNSQSILGLIQNSTAMFRDRNEDGLPFGLTRVEFIDPAGTTGTLPLEPGSYEVVVSRGTEYSADTAPITVTANTTEIVNAEIAPVVDSTGFISGDFHVHSIDSADCEVTKLERIVSMLAEGQEFFTPSDHGFRGDFAPIITANGWDNLVTTAINAEITTFDYGHFNAWPVTVDPGQVNGGTVDHGGAAPAGQDFPSFGNYNLTPEQIISAVKDDDPGDEAVQINHFASHFGLSESGDLGSGLAIDTGLEPPMSMVPASARRLDPAESDISKGYFTDEFTALEAWIGAGSAGAVDQFLGENAGDWFNLLNQGIVRTAIADSDTHQRKITQAGFPRTMIASTESDLTLLDDETLAMTVNDGKVFGTNGPMVRVTLEALTSSETASLEAGDDTLVTAMDGEVEITVTIQSPAWAEFDTVEYYLNSTTIQRILEDRETGAGMIDVARYGIAPDFVDTPTVTLVTDVDPNVSGSDRLEATSTLTLDGGVNPALTEDTWIVVMVKGTDGVSEPLFPVVPNDIDESQCSSAGTGCADDSDCPALETCEPVDSLGELTDGNLGQGGVRALAFTNPVFVDVDGNGDYDAPGVSWVPEATTTTTTTTSTTTTTTL